MANNQRCWPSKLDQFVRLYKDLNKCIFISSVDLKPPAEISEEPRHGYELDPWLHKPKSIALFLPRQQLFLPTPAGYATLPYNGFGRLPNAADHAQTTSEALY